MKARYKYVLMPLAVIVLLLCTIIYFGPVGKLVRYVGKQMDIGTAYMNSLSTNDIQEWILRADKMIENYTPEASNIYGDQLPDDIAELGIICISISPDRVIYVWIGGVDHTELIVQRHMIGLHTVTARYNDYEDKVLWSNWKMSQ